MAKALVNVKSEDKAAKKVVPIIQVKLLDDEKAIIANIATIQKAGKALETLMHNTAMSILVHVEKHGNITLANRMIEAVPSSVRKNALREWFTSFGKFSYDDETKLLKYKKTAKTNQADASQMPFWEFKAEPPYKAFNLLEALAQVVKRAEDNKNDTTRKQDVIPDDVLNVIKTVLVKADPLANAA